MAADIVARVEALIVTLGADGSLIYTKDRTITVPGGQTQGRGGPHGLRRCLSCWSNPRLAERPRLGNHGPDGLVDGLDQDRIARAPESRIYAVRVRPPLSRYFRLRNTPMSKSFVFHIRVGVRGSSGQGCRSDLRRRIGCHPRRRSARPGGLRDPGQDRRRHRRRRGHHECLGGCRGAGAQDRARYRL